VPRGGRGQQHHQQQQAALRVDPEDGSNLFVAGLASTVTDAALERAFARFGSVLSAKVMLRVASGVSRGFGFVLYATAAEAEAARAALHGTAIPGHGGRLQVSVSKHRGENLTAESRVVYVRNVPTSLVDSDELSTFLQRFGDVERTTTRANPNTAHPVTNIAVTYATIEGARRCVVGCHGKSPFAACEIGLLAKMEEPLTLRSSGGERGTSTASTARNGGAKQGNVQPSTNGRGGQSRVGHTGTPAGAAPAAPHHQQQHPTFVTAPPPPPNWPPLPGAGFFGSGYPAHHHFFAHFHHQQHAHHHSHHHHHLYLQPPPTSQHSFAAAAASAAWMTAPPQHSYWYPPVWPTLPPPAPRMPPAPVTSAGWPYTTQRPPPPPP
jgi:hypothetical protein